MPAGKYYDQAVGPGRRKHKATAPSTAIGFLSLTRAFAQDGTLSPNAKAVAVVMASHADFKTGLVSASDPVLEEEANVGIDVLKEAREELHHTGYVKRIRPTDSKGRFVGVKYYMTEKLVHRYTKKRLP